MYRNFLDNISQQVIKEYDTILAEYNFEYGDEFEFAICRFLRTFLPKKYSICRGYIVDQNDQIAGDDIIIYDANLFPKLRIVNDDFTVKQYIPYDAVYAYIEAKHTIEQPVLSKAFKQVEAVKKLTREDRRVTETDFCNFQPSQIIPAENWPHHLNPIYGCVISRNLKKQQQATTFDTFKNYIDQAAKKCIFYPDLIITGDRWISIPVINSNPLILESPFFIPDKSKLASFEAKLSIGAGMCTLLFALNFIKLKQINYKNLLAEGLGIEMVD